MISASRSRRPSRTALLVRALTGLLAALLVVAAISAVVHSERGGGDVAHGPAVSVVSEIAPSVGHPGTFAAETLAAEPDAAAMIACVIGALCAMIIIVVLRHRLLSAPQRDPRLRPLPAHLRALGAADSGTGEIPLLLRLGVLRI